VGEGKIGTGQSEPEMFDVQIEDHKMDLREVNCEEKSFQFAGFGVCGVESTIPNEDFRGLPQFLHENTKEGP
jgi:hypothetical protein